MSLIYAIIPIGLIFLGLGIYIFTVNPNGPSAFPIGPLIADNNNTKIQDRTGINFNLSADYTLGVVSIVMGSFFTGLLPALWIYDKIHRKPSVLVETRK